MPANRMNREEFFAKLAALEEDRLRKALWTLYWRGSASVREVIEGELDPVEDARRKRAAAGPPDPARLLHEVREFAELARAGAYVAGDRRVSPKERTRWRVTFRRLAADAEAALRAPESVPAEEALALIIDLACEMKDSGYFRKHNWPASAGTSRPPARSSQTAFANSPASRISPASPPRSAPGGEP